MYLGAGSAGYCHVCLTIFSSKWFTARVFASAFLAQGLLYSDFFFAPLSPAWYCPSSCFFWSLRCSFDCLLDPFNYRLFLCFLVFLWFPSAPGQVYFRRNFYAYRCCFFSSWKWSPRFEWNASVNAEYACRCFFYSLRYSFSNAFPAYGAS